MSEDPIVAEVRKARAAHAARFGNDLDAIFRDVKQQEQNSGREFVHFPPKRKDSGDRGHSPKTETSPDQE